MNQKLKRGKNTCGLPKISTAKSSPTMQKTTEMLLNLIRVDFRIRKEMKYSCIHAVFTVYHQTLPQVQPNKQAQAPACVQTPVVCRSARRQCAVFLFFFMHQYLWERAVMQPVNSPLCLGLSVTQAERLQDNGKKQVQPAGRHSWVKIINCRVFNHRLSLRDDMLSYRCSRCPNRVTQLGNKHKNLWENNCST